MLQQIEKDTAPALLRDHKMICQQLQYKDEAAVLYLARSHWTNRFDPNRESTIGIFFSIWVSPELIKQQQLAYNVHSKQLRKLPDYKLTSRRFADDFRNAVRDRVAGWPGVSLDYGPVTLLEGCDSCSLDNLADKVDQRVSAFIGISTDIDRLLKAAAS